MQISSMQIACTFAGATVRPAVPRRPCHAPVRPMAVLERPGTRDAGKAAVPSTPNVGITLPSRPSGSAVPDSTPAANAAPISFADEATIEVQILLPADPLSCVLLAPLGT